MDLLMTSTQMDGWEAELQAKQAIAHVLQTIRDNPEIAWYLGIGTQSFSLLTEAAATLWGVPLLEVREKFLPPKVINPREPK